MKKGLLAISTVIVFGIAVMGCATKGDLEKMAAQQQQTNLKADQALKAAQDANENATKASQASNQKADQAFQAAQQANEAAKMAEQKADSAEETAQAAEAQAQQANTTFKQSMKK